VTNANGIVITDASAVKAGDRIHARLGKGALDARVERTELPQDTDEQTDEQ
jgi:exonuclease VII large subunit